MFVEWKCGYEYSMLYFYYALVTWSVVWSDLLEHCELEGVLIANFIV